MPTSQFARLEQLATTNHDAANYLGDIFSGGVSIQGIQTNYRKALEYYILGDILKPIPKYRVGALAPSKIRMPLSQMNQISETIRMDATRRRALSLLQSK